VTSQPVRILAAGVIAGPEPLHGETAVTAAGTGASAAWAALGPSVTFLDAAGFNPVGFFGKTEAKLWDRAGQLAMAAARLTLATADGDTASAPATSLTPGDCGIVLGTAYGNMGSVEKYLKRLVARGPRLVSSMQFAQAGTGVAAAMIALDLGRRGYNLTISQGNTSGLWALAQAAIALRSGRARMLLAGGVEAVSDVRSLCRERPAEAAALLLLGEPDRDARTLRNLVESVESVESAESVESSDSAGPRTAPAWIAGVGLGPGPQSAIEAAAVDAGLRTPPAATEHFPDAAAPYGAASPPLALLLCLERARRRACAVPHRDNGILIGFTSWDGEGTAVGLILALGPWRGDPA